MPDLNRRDFARQSLGSILTYSLLEALCAPAVLAADVQPVTSDWIKTLNDLSRDVKGNKLTQVEWQAQVEALFARINLRDLLRFIDFEQLTRNAKLVDRGARQIGVGFPEVEGIPKKLVFGRQIFALKKDRSVVPHGHNNMATAFFILKGDCHGRHYDRVEDRGDHYIIKPTIDRTFAPAEYSTISDFRDNVHWFKSLTDSAFIFNIHVLDVDPANQHPTGRVYVNPEGESLQGRLIRAPIVSYKEANRLFG